MLAREAMGCTLSAADEADRKRSEEIDKTLAAEHLNRTNEIKLLLLGRKMCVCTCRYIRSATTEMCTMLSIQEEWLGING